MFQAYWVSVVAGIARRHCVGVLGSTRCFIARLNIRATHTSKLAGGFGCGNRFCTGRRPVL